MTRQFTEEQAAAIGRREGPLLLSAAAGSGKTSVLVERFARMVVEDGIAPGRILVITFTDKAAGELRSRIRAALLDRGERLLAQDAEAAWITTFHGFCARVLRANAVAAGLDPNFAVLDEAAGRELREGAFEAAVAGLLGPPDGSPRHDALDLVAAYGVDRLKTTVLGVYGQLRSAGQPRPALPDPPPAPDPAPLRVALDAAREAARRCLEGASGARVEAAREAIAAGRAFSTWNMPALIAGECTAYLDAVAALEQAAIDAEGAAALALVDELLGRCADAHTAAKAARSVVDFDDLELLAAGLFAEQPGLAASWAGRFERIMVDEFQDTNRVQVALLAHLDRDNVFCVGDELQSIYGFRHATVEVFRERRALLEDSDGVRLLTTNFRTRAEILTAINAVSAGLHDRFEPLIAGREHEPADGPLVELLLTDAEGWDESNVGRLPGGPPWRWAEARLLATRIRELVDEGTPPSDIVVLVRAATDIACFERAVEETGLSTLAAGGRGFWARQQVQDLTGYLAALANPRDELALLGVLASPLGPRLSSDALARLGLAARAGGRGLWAAVEEADGDERLSAWRERFLAERARAPRLSLAELLTELIAVSGYDRHVLGLPGGVRRLANVRKLVRLAAAYEREAGRHVRGFIDRATAELEAEAREPDAPVELQGCEAVRLMTIHAAKGLEFPVVCVADLGRDPNTQVPDVLVEGDRVGLRLVTLSRKANTALYDQLKEERQRRDREESLRVFHVAMTRARDRLILSGATKVDKWPAGEHCAPVAWLFPAFAAAGIEPTLSTAAQPRFGPPQRGGGERSAGTSVQTCRTPPAGTPIAPPTVSTLSYSALSDYSQCGYRFYLERILRLPKQDPPPKERLGGLDPLTRGSLVHVLLEDLREPADEEIAERARLMDVELTAGELADVRVLVRGGLSSPVVRRALEAPEVRVEEPFALGLADHPHVPLFTGYLDLRAIEADGSALVVDYKTDHLGHAGLDGPGPCAGPEAVVAGSYGVQRRLYGLAALRAGAPQVEVAHLFVERPDEPATVRYTQDDAERLEAELAASAGDLLAGRFVVAPRPHYDLCATCPGRNGLCSWPNETTLQPLSD